VKTQKKNSINYAIRYIIKFIMASDEQEAANGVFHALFNPSKGISIFPDFDCEVLQQAHYEIAAIPQRRETFKAGYAQLLTNQTEKKYFEDGIVDKYLRISYTKHESKKSNNEASVSLNLMREEYPGILQASTNYVIAESLHTASLMKYVEAHRALLLTYLQLNMAFFQAYERLKINEPNFIVVHQEIYKEYADYYPELNIVYELLSDVAQANFWAKQTFERVITDTKTTDYMPMRDLPKTVSAIDLLPVAKLTLQIRNEICAFRNKHMNEIISMIEGLRTDHPVSAYGKVLVMLKRSERECEQEARELINSKYNDGYGWVDNKSIPFMFAAVHAHMCIQTYVLSELKAPKNDFRVKCEDWIKARTPEDLNAGASALLMRPARSRKPFRELDFEEEPEEEWLRELKRHRKKSMANPSMPVMDILRYHDKLKRDQQTAQTSEMFEMRSILRATSDMYRGILREKIGGSMRCKQCKKRTHL
jgi:hypothetical protein